MRVSPPFGSSWLGPFEVEAASSIRRVASSEMLPSESRHADLAQTSIVLAADDTYLPFVPCMLGQLHQHAPGRLVTLLVASDATSMRLQRCVQVAARLSVPLVIREVDDINRLRSRSEIFDRDYVSAFTYVKLMLPTLLPDLDQVLYLDVDILLRDDISELLDWQLHHSIGAIPELGTNGRHIHGNVRVPYFNAGVLRMSLERLRGEDLWGQAQAVLRRTPRLQFQDQDVFNICYHHRFDALPLTFNVFNSVAMSSTKYQLFDDPVVLHFTGPRKPWMEEMKGPFAREWRAMNAEVLELDPEQTKAYIRGVAEKREVTATRIERLRQSPPADLARRHLPLAVKQRINSAVYAVTPAAPGTRFKGLPKQGRRRRFIAWIRFSETGMTVASHVPGWIRRPATVALASVAPAGALPPKSPARVAEGDQPPSATLQAVAGRARTPTLSPKPASGRSLGDSQPSPRLRILASRARSGTNATGNLISLGFEDVRWVSELYGGFPNQDAVPGIRVAFPWLNTIGDARLAGLTPQSPGWQGTVDEFRNKVSEQVVELTEFMISARPEVPVVKLLSGQLDPDAVAALLSSFTPDLLVLRRTNLFSYVSWLRARSRDVWIDVETTDHRIEFDADDVDRYIRQGDQWHQLLASHARELDLSVTHVTYEGLLERRTELKLLKEFFRDLAPTRTARNEDTWLPKRVIQDRRTDESLGLVLEQFTKLPDDLRHGLLRLPGEEAWADRAPLA